MDDRLREQIEYYRERAAEYDDWWTREGRYELPPDLARKWGADVAQVEQAVHDFAPTGRVLELACGTGLFTRHIAGHADHITALDSSPEVIELNRSRLPGAAIDYVVADVFGWPFPRSAYDAVVFTYWMSHVPDDRLDGFWTTVRGALRPGGRVFLVDSSTNHFGTSSESDRQGERRTLRDGRSYRIVKRYWNPAELDRYLAQRGWTCRARLTDNEMILYASVLPS